MVLVAILSIGLLCALFIQPKEDEPEAEPKDGAVISETAEHGVSLMSAKISPAAYAANGVSALADTAYTLTASVEPDYAGERPLIGLSNLRTAPPRGRTGSQSPIT